jgi:FixJ family two-component response regulator
MSPAPNLVGMPKSAADEIELGGDERAELEHRAACYTLSFRQVRRARLVLYAAEGHTNREIAQRLDMNEEVVGRWRRLPRRVPRGARESGARARQDHRARAPACACDVTDRDRVAVSRLKGAARGR